MSQEWLIFSWGLPLLIYIRGQNYLKSTVLYYILFDRKTNFFIFWSTAARKITGKLKPGQTRHWRTQFAFTKVHKISHPTPNS